MTSLLAKHPQNFVRILPVVFSFCHQDAVTAVLMPEYSPFFNAPGNDVVESSRSLPATCPPLPRMPGFGVYAVIGRGRRVASSGEAGGHLFVIFSACKPNSIPN
ncbi:MAG: hypothetical protein JRJ79_09690 [Deltaproteobacteria bacterium]|nr:hypothetical protein [Deltaproteobacteria bacterium]MBW1796233.1 hypothetical protein [Deltaproteobacteria bacterium]